ncbi:unnamed protein product, partial [Staurois parvus]
IRRPLYIWCLPSVFPLTSVVPIRGVPIRVSPYIRCAHQSAPLHQLSPSECPFTSVVPIRVPLYIRYPHHIATLHQVFLSEGPLTLKVPLSIPIRVP